MTTLVAPGELIDCAREVEINDAAMRAGGE